MADRLSTVPQTLIKEYNTRDPFFIARMLGYSIKFINTKKQKGFCKNFLNNYFIFINANMSDQMQRMTCAHELGHCIFHKDELRNREYLVEMEIFDIHSRTEYEANLFAANLLIDGNEAIDKLREGRDIVSIASELNVNVNLLAIKLSEMQREGLPIRIPFTPDRKFMGQIEDRADSI